MTKRCCEWLFTLIFLALVCGGFALAQTTSKPKSAKPALTKAEIAEAKATLSALGYWLDPAASGLDASLRHALIAFQKMEGRPRTGVLTGKELVALRNAQAPQPRETGFAHIEVDLTRQVLFVVRDDGTPTRILPISSGSGEWFTEGGRTRQAVTPTGRFKVTHQIKGWRKSPLGLLYYPNYIYNGIAIHGNPAVPATPASHGCIRIPMFAAQAFSDMAKPGTVVMIYDDELTKP
ncbi:MAG TPA: L,D-transpeptidase family protein [Blastocatellia bacterium]|nr:L,D-transpeptidase family protein [Blastocatellia bacterium]